MFASFARGGQRRAFWHLNQQKKRQEGVRGRRAVGGDMPLGEGGVLKGNQEGVRRSLGKTVGGERDVCHRVFKRE